MPSGAKLPRSEAGKRMDAQEAFITFVGRVLIREKAERYTALATTKNGFKKILTGLCHEFEHITMPSAVRGQDYSAILNTPCFVYYEPMGFGIEFSTVREAYEKLSITDSWLIITGDGSAGIHRPENRWDDERLLQA
jgi:hypothetical protein